MWNRWEPEKYFKDTPKKIMLGAGYKSLYLTLSSWIYRKETDCIWTSRLGARKNSRAAIEFFKLILIFSSHQCISLQLQSFPLRAKIRIVLTFFYMCTVCFYPENAGIRFLRKHDLFLQDYRCYIAEDSNLYA